MTRVRLCGQTQAAERRDEQERKDSRWLAHVVRISKQLVFAKVARGVCFAPSARSPAQ
jgi:hypothetical protein